MKNSAQAVRDNCIDGKLWRVLSVSHFWLMTWNQHEYLIPNTFFRFLPWEDKAINFSVLTLFFFNGRCIRLPVFFFFRDSVASLSSGWVCWWMQIASVPHRFQPWSPLPPQIHFFLKVIHWPLSSCPAPAEVLQSESQPQSVDPKIAADFGRVVKSFNHNVRNRCGVRFKYSFGIFTEKPNDHPQIGPEVNHKLWRLVTQERLVVFG